MLKFTLDDGKVKLDALHTNLAIIKEVLKMYKGEMGIRVLTFIHIVSRLDPSAPFFTAADDEIWELVMMQLFSKDEWKTIKQKSLEKWITDYKKMYEKPEVRIVNIFNDKVDEIRKLIQDTTPEITAYTTTSGSSGYSTNLPIITKAMSELGDLLDVKDKLEAKIRKQVIGGRMRAGKTPSLLEKQMM